MENHSLSQKLSWLLSDKEHLLSCLEPWAFLCQESLAEATLICLRAVERNQAALLTEIDPCLVKFFFTSHFEFRKIPKTSPYSIKNFPQFVPGGRFLKNSPKRHRRSSSYPVNFGSSRAETNFAMNDNHSNKDSKDTEKLSPSQQKNLEKRTTDEADATPSSDNAEERESEISLKSWNSLPVLCKDHEICQRSCALPLAAFMATTNRPDENSSPRPRSRTIELSDVIKIDYSEAKASSSSQNIYVKPKKPKTPLRKQRAKTKNASTTKFERKNSNGSSDTLNYEDNASTEVVMEIIGRTSKDIANFHTDNPSSESIKIETHKKVRRRSLFSSSGSASEMSGGWSFGVEGQKDIRTPKKSFMEDGGSSVQPMATGYFPRPLQGQSLTSFLTSSQFSRANAELDRENAHFSISEAMIAAIEQVKCNRQLRLIDETVDESDEEINHLKQRIRLRRHQRQMEQRKGAGNWSRELLSDGKTDSTFVFLSFYSFVSF